MIVKITVLVFSISLALSSQEFAQTSIFKDSNFSNIINNNNNLLQYSDKVDSIDNIKIRGKDIRVIDSNWTIDFGTLESKGLLLLADHITYNHDTKNIYAEGHIRFEGTSFRLHCSKLHMNFSTEIGEAFNLKFELSPNWVLNSNHVKFNTREHWEFSKVKLSLYLELRPAWTAQASKLIVDLDKYAYFHNLWIKVFGLPTHYFLPYLVYPVTDDRLSGILPISIALSPKRFCVGVPYYFAISDTVDATLSPKYSTDYGLTFGGELRWHPEIEHKGNIAVHSIKQQYRSLDCVDSSKIFFDSQFDKNKHKKVEYKLNIMELWQHENGWQFSANINRLSGSSLSYNYDDSIKFGEEVNSSTLYFGKSFSSGYFSSSAVNKNGYLSSNLLYPLYIKRSITPNIKFSSRPVYLKSYNFDYDVRIDNIHYNIKSIDHDSESNFAQNILNTSLMRFDIFARVLKNLYSNDLLYSNLKLGTRLTYYTRRNSDAHFDLNTRILGSVKLEFGSQTLGRIFNNAIRISNTSYDLNHTINPYCSLIFNTKSNNINTFDSVDSQPGIANSLIGERSVEFGLKQHFLYKLSTSGQFLNAICWKLAAKFNLDNNNGLNTIENNINFELSRKMHINFWQNIHNLTSEHKSDTAISINYHGVDNKTRYNIALFSNVADQNFVSQQGAQLGFNRHIFDDKIILELSCNYNTNIKSITIAQAAIAYVRPCISGSLRLCHIDKKIMSVTNGCKRNDDRLLFAINLRNIGELFKTTTTI